LKQLLGINESGIVGDSVVSWKNVTQERFDSKSFEIEQPELYKKYTRNATHRRFIIKAANHIRKVG
jgi:predicted phage-related endonuclease